MTVIHKPNYDSEFIVKNPIVVTGFYKFTPISNIEELKSELRQYLRDRDIRGKIIISVEGINGMLSSTRDKIDAVYEYLQNHKDINTQLEFKENLHYCQPFKKPVVKSRKEIISFDGGECAIDPGEYLDAAAWDKLIQDKNTVLIDTRNDYEVAAGTFKNAINPDIHAFSELKTWCDNNLTDKNKPIAMFCTGGIRCEKSTSYLKQKGFKNVYHLKNGIIGYLMETKNKNKLWQDDCFVFDYRMKINSDLA